MNPPPRAGRWKALGRLALPGPGVGPALVSGLRGDIPQGQGGADPNVGAGGVPGSHRTAAPSSPQDSRLYLVFPHDSSALSNSFHHLQLFDQDSSNVVSVSPGWAAGRPAAGMGGEGGPGGGP